MMRLALLLWVMIVFGCQGGGSPSTPSLGPAGGPAGTPPVGVGSSTAPAESAVALTAPASPVPVGQEVQLALTTQEAHNLYGVTLTLRYDPAQLAYVRSLEGDLLNRDGAATVVEVLPSDDTPGELVVGLSRLGEVGGVSGSGTLLTLVFQAKQSGPAQVRVDDTTAALRDADDTPLAVTNWKGVTLAIQ